MDEITKKELKGIVRNTGISYVEARELAKEDLDILAKSIKDKFGIPVGDFKKMCELEYEQNLEEEKEKALKKFRLFEEVMGGNDEV